jgi:hypothetical protein
MYPEVLFAACEGAFDRTKQSADLCTAHAWTSPEQANGSDKKMLDQGRFF